MRDLLIALSAAYCFVLAALAGGLGLLNATTTPRTVLYHVVILVLPAWTGAGLLRRRRWSRISVQVVALYPIFMGVAAVNTAVNPKMRLPPYNLTPVPLTDLVYSAFFGLCGLVFFNLPKVRAAFREAPNS